MKNKYIYLIIGIIIIVVVLSLINHFSHFDLNNQIKKTLLEDGFVATAYDDLFIKNEDDNKSYSFSIANYTYMLEVDDGNNGINSSLNATYDFKDNTLIYSYRVNYLDRVNVLFKGTYNEENFTCDKEFSNASLSNSEKETICSLAENNIKIFKIKANSLFNNYKIINSMKQK